jgi:hypothetical protein
MWPRTTGTHARLALEDITVPAQQHSQSLVPQGLIQWVGSSLVLTVHPEEPVLVLQMSRSFVRLERSQQAEPQHALLAQLVPDVPVRRPLIL